MTQCSRGYKKVTQGLGGGKKQLNLEIIFSENKKKKKKNFICTPCQGFADANRTINIPMLFINQHITGCGKYGIKDKLELEFNLSLSILCSSAAEFESFF